MLKWLRSNTLGTYLFTRRKGELVGEDAAGNHYYRERGAKDWRTERRWVVYAGDIELDGSMVPPGWHGWLGRSREKAPSEEPLATKRWEKEHQPNLSGSLAAYVPPGPRAARRAARPGYGRLRGVAAVTVVAACSQPVALEVEERRQRLGRLRAGDHMVVAEHADRHAGDSRGAGPLRAPRRPLLAPVRSPAAAIVPGIDPELRLRSAPARPRRRVGAGRRRRRETGPRRSSSWQAAPGRRQQQGVRRHGVRLRPDRPERERDALAGAGLRPRADARPAPGRRCRTCARDTARRVTPRGGRCGLSRNGCQTDGASRYPPAAAAAAVKAM